MVDLLRTRLADVAHVHGLLHDIVDERVTRFADGFELFRIAPAARLDLFDLFDVMLHEVARLVVLHDRRREDVEQVARALLVAADRLDARHAEAFFELLRVDAHAAALRIVLHVEVDEERDALLEELDCEVQVALDVRAVDDVDDEVKLRVHEVIDDDLFLRAARVDAVRAREVDDGNRAILVTRVADFLVDRHAGPVADFLARAREFVEDR